MQYKTTLCYVIEGANLLLQRLLIRKTLPGNFALLSLDADARLCPVSYVSFCHLVSSL
jgi:hypothetical protein